MLMPTKKGLERASQILKQAREGTLPKPATREETDTRLAARRKQASEDQIKKDVADLPNLEKQHAEMQAIHEKGKNWQYADREQNMTEAERQARNVAGPMSNLGSRISAAKRSTSSYAKGGKISLGDCGVSTAAKGKKNSDW